MDYVSYLAKSNSFQMPMVDALDIFIEKLFSILPGISQVYNT